MRLVLATTLATMILTGPALAKGNPQMQVCASQWKTMSHAGTTHKQFMATCLASAKPSAPATSPAMTAPVARAAPMAPAAPAARASVSPMAAPMTSPAASVGGAPANATAKCKDGSFSTSLHHSGSCSHHGGVAAWLK